MINMQEKMSDPEFLGDTTMLLRPEIKFDPIPAWKEVHDKLVAKLMK